MNQKSFRMTAWVDVPHKFICMLIHMQEFTQRFFFCYPSHHTARRHIITTNEQRWFPFIPAAFMNNLFKYLWHFSLLSVFNFFHVSVDFDKKARNEEKNIGCSSMKLPNEWIKNQDSYVHFFCTVPLRNFVNLMERRKNVHWDRATSRAWSIYAFFLLKTWESFTTYKLWMKLFSIKTESSLVTCERKWTEVEDSKEEVFFVDSTYFLSLSSSSLQESLRNRRHQTPHGCQF